MSDQITYNFEANYQTLDTIKSAAHDAEEMKENLDRVFQLLTDEAYHGSAPEELLNARQQISSKMDSIIQDLHHTHVKAVDQQTLVQDLDRSQAANILG